MLSLLETVKSSPADQSSSSYSLGFGDRIRS